MSDVPTSGWGLFRVLPSALPYARPYWKLGCISIAMTVLTAVLSLAQPWPLALMVDTVHPGVPLPPEARLRRAINRGEMVLDVLLGEGVPIA